MTTASAHKHALSISDGRDCPSLGQGPRMLKRGASCARPFARHRHGQSDAAGLDLEAVNAVNVATSKRYLRDVETRHRGAGSPDDWRRRRRAMRASVTTLQTPTGH